ncbi:MAG: tryptophan synthase subunit alpha [Actinobacteria bacterium]|nr:tryptophan synthase subunit alpha [Actinomycetota bacterium]
MAGREDVEHAFRRTVGQGRATLVIYLPAGYPDMDTSRACLEAAAHAGADVLEVGIPFSDPMMDGPTIQAATQAALERGYTVDADLEMCAALTEAVPTPVLAMTYYTIPDARGLDRFADDLASVGIDGAILPDLPAQEAQPWLDAAARHDLATVFLASSVSAESRLTSIAAISTGFVYATGLLGVTGVKDVDHGDAASLVKRLRALTNAPVAVGVGVKTGEQAATVAGYADGVIVGSAVVTAAGDGDPAGAPERVAALVRELRAGIERAAS